MRNILTMIMILLPFRIFASGQIQELALEECVTASSAVYIVQIIDSGTFSVKELEPYGKDVSSQLVYHARILDIMNHSLQSANDSWSFSIPQKFVKTASLGKKKTPDKLTGNDELLITNYENVLYSVIYHVENRHKIFYYYQCKEEAETIVSGGRYIFVSGSGPSKKNGIMYGSIRYGLFPDTSDIKKRITAILKKKNTRLPATTLFTE